MLISYFKHILSQRSLKSHRITLGKFRGQSVDQNKHCPALSARPTHITQRTLTLLWFSEWTTEYCFVVLALWPAATMKLKLLLLLLVFFCTFIIPAQVRFKPPWVIVLTLYSYICAHLMNFPIKPAVKTWPPSKAWKKGSQGETRGETWQQTWKAAGKSRK